MFDQKYFPADCLCGESVFPARAHQPRASGVDGFLSHVQPF